MDNESQQSNASPQTARLIEVLQDLETHIKRQNSLKYVFIKGLLYGLSTVIGATVLVALIGGILAVMFGPLDENSTITKILELRPN